MLEVTVRMEHDLTECQEPCEYPLCPGSCDRPSSLDEHLDEPGNDWHRCDENPEHTWRHLGNHYYELNDGRITRYGNVVPRPSQTELKRIGGI